jgi:hypothetical protein
MSIVLDDSVTSHASNEPQVSPAGSSDRSLSQATNLYHCSIRDQDPAGAVAVAEMQVRRALLGAKLIRSSAKLTTSPKTETRQKVRNQDKVLLKELAHNISTKNHLPESFTILPAPEDRRPVQSDLQEATEPNYIHKSQTWESHVNSIVKAGSGEVQVSADWLLQQLGET